MKELIGKTIKSIEQPEEMEMDVGGGLFNTSDENIKVTFTDGTVLKLSSWDYESYISGIYKQIITK